MTALAYTLGVVLVALGIGLSIALHELGHLVAAKRFGVRVTQYMIGFGPTLWSRTWGETEYGIKLLPLGGYCSIVGMIPPAGERGVTAQSTWLMGKLVQEARDTSAADILPGEEERVFYRLPTWKKLAVMLGGIGMNLVLGVVLLTITLSVIGTDQTITRVASVSQCVVPADRADQSACRAGDPAGPAAAAGLRSGDTIVGVNGRATTDWEVVRTAIRDHPGRTVTLAVERDGTTRDVRVTPAAAQRPVYDASGAVERTAGGAVRTETVGFLGLTPDYGLVRQPLSTVPATLASSVGQITQAIWTLPQRAVQTARTLFGDQPRDPNGLMSVVGVGRVAGEITSTEVADHHITVAERASSLVGILASLNLSLFAFNLIPLLPFDGGHAAGAVWEAIKRWWARLRRRPDPGYVDVARALPLTYTVSALLLVMGGLFIAADIFKPIAF